MRIKGRGFKGRNNYVSKDLKAMFGLKPLKADRKVLVVSLEDMKPTTFSSMREATRAIDMGERVSRCARNNGKDFTKRFEGGNIMVFSIKWC